MRLADNGRACHPKIRRSSLRHYVLDEASAASASSGEARDVVRGKTADVIGTGTAPPVCDAPTPRARRWSSSLTECLAETDADDELVAALQGDCCIGVLFRVTSLTPWSSGNIELCCVSGPSDDASANTNFVRALRIRSTGELGYFWEHSTGTNVGTTNFGNYLIDPFKWTYAVLRIRDATGVGPGGTVSVSLCVNGVQVDEDTLITNTSGGADAVLRIGHSLNADGTTVEGVGNVDIAGVYIWGEALTDEEIQEDFRRIQRLGFFTRLDASVVVTDTAGAEHDLCDLEGNDFVDSIEIDDDIDNATMNAKVTLRREVGQLSLAALVTESKLNLEDKGDPTSYVDSLVREDAPIEVFVARVPLGISANAGELRLLGSIFKGQIDEVDDASGDGQVVVDARDDGGRLLNTYEEEEVEYGADPAVAVEGEMQYILNDNDNSTGNNSVTGLTARSGSYAPITLYTPVSPGWAVLPWQQRREPVLSSLRTLAGQIAWDCRYRYDQNPSQRAWRLTFFEPDRSKVATDVVISPDDVIDVRSLKRSTFGRRTVWRVIYPSSETSLPTAPTPPAGHAVRRGWYNVDGLDQRMVAYVEVEATAMHSAGRQRQFAEVQEEQTTQIDTIDEAYAMAIGLLLDTEDPGIAKEVEVPALADLLELNDMCYFRRLRELFTSPQTLATRNLRHTIGDKSTTTVQLRGKPAAGFKRWLRLESRNGRPGIVDPTQALTDTTTGNLLSRFRGILDRSSMFLGGKFLQIRNSDFSQYSAGLANPPDGWSMKTGAWDTDATVVSSASLTGGKALKLISSTAEVRSDFIPVTGDFDTPFSFEAIWQFPAGSSPGATTKRLELAVEWYTAAKSLISTSVIRVGGTAYPPSQFPDVTAAAATWYSSRVDGISPPAAGTARFARLVLRPDTDGTHSMLAQGIFVDLVTAYRTAREAKTFLLNNWTITGGSTGAAAWYNINLRSVGASPVYDSHDWGHNQFTYSGGSDIIPREDGTNETLGATFRGAGFYCKEPGTYLITAQVTLLWNSTGTPPTPTARLVKNATYTSSSNQLNTGGTPIAQAVGSTWDTLTNYNSGSSVAGFTNAQVSTVCITTRVTLARGDRVTFEFQRGTSGGQNITPVTATEIANYQQLTWWAVRMNMAE